MGRDYRGILIERFDGLLARWLKALPDGGWTGTPTELGAALNDAARHGEHVGAHVTSKVKFSTAPAAAGFVVEEARTGKARRVTIRRREN